MNLIRHVTFRQLQVFEAIARTNSFTAAAEELCLTQPTVSMQIKKLTDAATISLFDYVGKRLYLTDAGKELLTASREIFESMSRFEMTVADMKGVKQGKLSLTAVTTAEYFAPRILGAFSQRYPGIKVVLNVTNRESILRRLVNNEDDLYIVGLPPDRDLHITPFLDNPLVVLAPPNHTLVGKRRVSLKRLSNEPFVVREPGTGTSMSFNRLLEERGLTITVRMELGSNEAVKQAVIGGLGLTVLSRHAAVHELQSRELAVLDVEGFPIDHQWHIVYPTGKQLSVVAQTFFNYLLKEGKDIAEEHLNNSISQDE